MSYILEALKKAQAERQLGSAPTIHTPSVHAVPVAAAGRKPLVIGFAAGALLVAGALLFWRQHGAAPAAPALPAVAANQPVTAPAPASAQTAAVAVPQTVAPAAPPAPATVPPPVQPAAAPMLQATVPPAAHAGAGSQVALVHDREPDIAPARPSRPHVQAPAPTPPAIHTGAGDTAQARATPHASEPPPKAAQPSVAPAQVQVAAAAPAAQAPAPVAAPEETLRTLNDLPDTVRNAVPRVAFGGYMYSPNPADRLVLVDKMLRREGEEVAPGLVLEKLLPRGAVMNYRGYRYRVAF